MFLTPVGTVLWWGATVQPVEATISVVLRVQRYAENVWLLPNRKEQLSLSQALSCTAESLNIV
jgi:hypothetical protein